jgi:hypothetical protein
LLVLGCAILCFAALYQSSFLASSVFVVLLPLCSRTGNSFVSQIRKVTAMLCDIGDVGDIQNLLHTEKRKCGAEQEWLDDFCQSCVTYNSIRPSTGSNKKIRPKMKMGDNVVVISYDALLTTKTITRQHEYQIKFPI